MCYVQGVFCYICVLLHVEIKYRKERRTPRFSQAWNHGWICRLYCDWSYFFWRNRNITIAMAPMCGASGVPAMCVISKQLRTKLAKSAKKLQNSSPHASGDLLFNVIWQRDTCKKHFWSRVHVGKKGNTLWCIHSLMVKLDISNTLK